MSFHLGHHNPHPDTEVMVIDWIASEILDPGPAWTSAKQGSGR